MNPAPNLVLVGPMGAGKSALGRRLADRFGLRFVDLDHAIETEAGANIPTLFAQRGEAAFRTLERDLLARLLEGEGLVIVNAGGEPAFEVAEAGDYTIHTLVYDPAVLDLGVVVPGVTTGFDVNGLLVPYVDLASLEEAIRRAFQPAIWQRLREQARILDPGRFDWDTMVSQTVEVLESFVQHNP